MVSEATYLNLCFDKFPVMRDQTSAGLMFTSGTTFVLVSYFARIKSVTS